MTPERAREILESGRFAFGAISTTYGGHMKLTAAEDKEIRDLWATMPGNTTYRNALERIAKGKA